jgi:hypothetical protein
VKTEKLDKQPIETFHDSDLDDDDEDEEDEDEDLSSKPRKHAKKSYPKPTNFVPSPPINVPMMQPPFQPGSTNFEGKRRYLGTIKIQNNKTIHDSSIIYMIVNY